MQTAAVSETMNRIAKSSRSSPLSSPSSSPPLPGVPELSRSGTNASQGAPGGQEVTNHVGSWPVGDVPASETGARRVSAEKSVAENGDDTLTTPSNGMITGTGAARSMAFASEPNSAAVGLPTTRSTQNLATQSPVVSHQDPTATQPASTNVASSAQPAAADQRPLAARNQSLVHLSNLTHLGHLAHLNNLAALTNAPHLAHHTPEPPSGPVRRSSFGLGFLSLFASSIRSQGTAPTASTEQFMSNSPTIANLHHHLHEDPEAESLPALNPQTSQIPQLSQNPNPQDPIASTATHSSGGPAGMDKDGCYSIRLTPLIDHSSSTSGLYFAPVIRKIKPESSISIGRYTDKNRAAAHAPQGSSSPIVFKSKVVSRTHALFQCNEEGLWFIKDCKSSSGTFLNHIRLSPASQELVLTPLVDGDIVQLGMDYRGGTEEVYRCVKMRCEFNKSWQRKVNLFNLEIHSKLKSLALDSGNQIPDPVISNNFSECAVCLLTLDPCQALFISPCSHAWHYKCIRPIIIKSYPQFYCPNCRSMCDLESDIEDDDD